MTLLGEVLVKLAAAPEERLPAVLAVLDGKGTPLEIVPAETWTIQEIMAEFGKSRATVFRKMTAAGVDALVTFQGLKRYSREDVRRAMRGGGKGQYTMSNVQHPISK